MSEGAANNEETAPRVIGRPFPPGVSGNPNGRPKDQFSFMGILRSALAEENKSGKSVGERIVRRYIKLALQGNQQAAEALMARIDGKPAQSLTLKGDSDAPLHVRHSARLEQEAKPKLPAPEQEQEAAEGEAVDAADVEFAPLTDGAVEGIVTPLGITLAGDPDHQAPDAAE